jgi:G3E family GTPase
VVIETSGLADPSPLIQAFLSDPTLAGLYRIGAVVATVDAVNGPGTLDNHIESVRQVALADHILITKLDLVEPAKDESEAEAALTARLHRLNPAAKFRVSTIRHSTSARCCATDGLDPNNAKADARAWLNAAAYEQHDDIIITITITAMTPITTIITCMTATSPRSASCARRRFRARRCACCSTPCSRISDPICCG